MKIGVDITTRSVESPLLYWVCRSHWRTYKATLVLRVLARSLVVPQASSKQHAGVLRLMFTLGISFSRISKHHLVSIRVKVTVTLYQYDL